MATVGIRAPSPAGTTMRSTPSPQPSPAHGINPSPTTTAATTNPIAKKLNKILDSKVETDQDLLDALETVSPYLAGGNTSNQRRNLRRDLEQRGLDTNLRFLESFRRVRDAVKAVSEDVERMDKCCAGMTDRLRQTKEQTRDLLNRTTSLHSQSQRVEKRADIAQAFLTAFQLTPEEAKALKGGVDGTIDHNFFPALARVKQIHSDCKQLLRTCQHAAALEIMEKMAAAQETAYELLYRWIQRECRLLNVEFVELNSLLCAAFESMQDRPVLFKYSLDEYNTARRNHVVRAFIDALTRGGPGGVPKPIELLSHDTLRYVGDMLAFIHQATASERETLQALLKCCKPVVLEEHSATVLGHVTEGICRPFKIRVEQALSGETQPVSLYRLSNLFSFYAETMKPSLLESAPFLRTIDELKDLTLHMFFSGLNTNVQRLLEKIVPPDPDLLPVQGVHQILLLLRDVLESHDTGLVAVCDKRQNFAKIFSSVLDPLSNSLIISATHLAPVDLAVYLLNCLSCVVSVISLYQYADQRLEMLQAQIDANEDVLVSEQASLVLQRTGLLDIYGKATAHQSNQGIDLAVLRSWRAGPVSLPAEGVDKLIVEWVYTPDGADTFSRSYFSSGHCMVRKKTIDIGYNE